MRPGSHNSKIRPASMRHEQPVIKTALNGGTGAPSQPAQSPSAESVDALLSCVLRVSVTAPCLHKALPPPNVGCGRTNGEP